MKLSKLVGSSLKPHGRAGEIFRGRLQIFQAQSERYQKEWKCQLLLERIRFHIETKWKRRNWSKCLTQMWVTRESPLEGKKTCVRGLNSFAPY